jgi:hypothetical protein
MNKEAKDLSKNLTRLINSEIIKGRTEPLTLIDFAKTFARIRYDTSIEAQENQDRHKILDTNITIREAYNLYTRLFQNLQGRGHPYERREYPLLPAKRPLRRGDKFINQITHFPIKHYLKKYGRHHVAPIGHYQMDIMISEPSYLIVIGIVSRYSFLQPLNFIHNSFGARANITQRDLASVQEALRNIIPQLKRDRRGFAYLHADAERAFVSNSTLTYLASKDVSIRAFPDNVRHTRMAIINRFIRTLRDDLYNQYGLTDYLPPNHVEEWVEDYNHRAHKTLSKLIGFPCSPLQVEEDDVLRDEIASHIEYLNSSKIIDDLEPADEIQIYKQPPPLTKIRSTVDDRIFNFHGMTKEGRVNTGDVLKHHPRWAVR